MSYRKTVESYLAASRGACGDVQSERRRKALKDEAFICQQGIVLSGPHYQMRVVLCCKFRLVTQAHKLDLKRDGSIRTAICNRIYAESYEHSTSIQQRYLLAIGRAIHWSMYTIPQGLCAGQWILPRGSTVNSMQGGMRSCSCCLTWLPADDKHHLQ